MRKGMRKIPLFGLPIDLLLVAVLIVTVLTAAVYADDVKMGAYGNVTWNGDPAPVDTKIEVFVGTEKSGEWIIEREALIGEYGLIKVTSDEENRGLLLTYKVNGIVANTTKVMTRCDLEQDPPITDPVFGACNQVVNLVAVSGAPHATWNFPGVGNFPRHLPDDYFGRVVLDDLDPEDIPWQVQGIYHESGAYWAPPPAPAGDYPLEYLFGGLYANYVLGVAASCQWNIEYQ